jgi:hypothetical protein
MSDSEDADLDLHKLIQMFDIALTSDDPRVRDALRNLLVISTLVQTDQDETKIAKSGPLGDMLARISILERRMRDLEQRAWRAGLSTWPNTSSPNNWGITYGVNTVNAAAQSSSIADGLDVSSLQKEHKDWITILRNNVGVAPGLRSILDDDKDF